MENSNSGIKILMIGVFVWLSLFGMAKWSLDRQAESAMNQIIEIAKIQSKKCESTK